MSVTRAEVVPAGPDFRDCYRQPLERVEKVDLQKRGVMQHPYNPRYSRQILLGHLQPQVERLDEFRPDLFAGIGRYVGVGLQQYLLSA